MSKIDVLVFFHILGALLLAAGAGIGMATGIAMTRTESVTAIRIMSAVSARSEHLVSVPGALLTLVTGVWLIADYDFFELDELWLWGSLVLWGIATVIALGVLDPFLRRLHGQAKELEAAGESRSAELRVAAGAPLGRFGGSTLTLLNVVFLYLMVARPGA